MGVCSIAALTLVCVLVPQSASAAVGPSSDGDLSARLAELAKPAVRAAPPAAQARALGLAAEGPGSLLREGNRVLVEVRFDRGAAAAVDDLRSAGAKIVNVSSRYQTVTVAARPGQLTALSGVPRVSGATEVLAPIASASTCPSGAVVSAGDAQLRAGEARAAPFEVDGMGVTVGILSDSFDHATEAADGSGPVATHEAEDVENGDLPGSGNTCPGATTPVAKLDDSDTGGEDEGRAMGQIVHDLAPGAKLAFATAFTSETAFAENIEKLAKPTGEGGAGAQVIADDVAYPEEPFFQEGPVGVAVSKVTGAGVSYFSSAANNNLIDGGRDIASWEAPEFRDSSGCPAGVVAFSESLEAAAEPGLNPTHCMDFNPGAGVDRTFRITVSKGATLRVDLQWAEPWEGVGTDLDAFLLGPGGGLLRSSIEDNVFDTKRPFEFIGWENKTGASAEVQLAVNRFSGGNPPLKFAFLENGGGVTSSEYESSRGGDVVGPTIFGHNGGEDAISVGAIRYDESEAPEGFSSRGPVTHYFGPVSGTTTPAEPLVPAQVLSKPDVTATDCGETTFFAFEEAGLWRFCGTSAAAPHAAAVAALMLQKEPLATPAQIRSALSESAGPIGGSGACAVGAGLVDAVGAIEALLAPGAGSAPACTPPESPPVVEEHEGERPFEEAEKKVVAANPPAEVQPPGEPPKQPPSTLFRKHPAHLIRTSAAKAKAVFAFGADEGGVTFSCQVDRAPFRACPQRFVGRFAAGAHVLRVVARDAAGSADPTPAVYRFRVKRVAPPGGA
jgi:hypothetical protein